MKIFSMILPLLIILTLFISACNRSAHFLDGTKWQGSKAIIEFKNGEIIVGNKTYPYQYQGGGGREISGSTVFLESGEINDGAGRAQGLYLAADDGRGGTIPVIHLLGSYFGNKDKYEGEYFKINK